VGNVGGNTGASPQGSGSAPTGLHGPVTSQGNHDLPTGYLRDAAGIVSRVLVDPNNPALQISHPISKYPMLNAWIQSDPMTLHFDSQVEIGRVAQIDIEFEAIGGMEMRKTLQRQGFMLIQNDKHSGDFFVSWVQKLQAMKASVASAPFGWQDKNGQTEGFIFGGQLWTPNGNSPSATANPVINQQYKPKGSDAYWLDAVKLVTSQGRPDLEAIVASAFAAPLVMFTGHLGMLMSAYSKESGIVYCVKDRAGSVGRSHSRSAVLVGYAKFCDEENRRSPFTADLLGRAQDGRGHEEIRQHDVSNCTGQGEVAAQSARADEGARALANACRLSEQRQPDRPRDTTDPDYLGGALQDLRIHGGAVFDAKWRGHK